MVHLGRCAAAAVPPGRQLACGGVPPLSASADGFVEHIHIATVAGAPVGAVETARAVARVGLEGDRYAYGKGHYQDARVSRDLTLIEGEALEALLNEHGIELVPGET